MKAISDADARLLRIRGLVQGVGYRNALLAEARRLGLNGWVRNRSDGSVEALACGTPDAIAALILWAHQGPPAAQVSHVEHKAAQPLANGGFERLPTL